ncbi:MAG: deoxyribonuclease IV [Candidatus Omnitrophota bacterium]|nr:deoxyribonuclease IV [Candidatus Omnitrophota bacterium]
MHLGVHVSIAGKIYDSIVRAESLGCTAMQIFSRNPREWKHAPLDPKDIQEFKKRRKKSRISPLVIHVPYLTNLASPRSRLFYNSVRYNIEYLREADALGAEYLVTHMGSHKKSGEARGLGRVTEALNRILGRTAGLKTMILLENTSGSGSWLGYKFWHIKNIFDNLVDKKRVGVCLDTCHAYSAGYDLASESGLESTLNELDSLVGLEKLKVIHLNDTKDELDSRRDRHEHIGKGKIGLAGFKRILHHPKLRNLAFILETPKEEQENDINNMKTVKKLSAFARHKS